MKQLLFLILALGVINAAKLYSCGTATSPLQFENTVSVYSLDSQQWLQFYANGNAISKVQTDYTQIRIYAEAPEFKTFKQGRFSYTTYSYSEGAYFQIADYANFSGLPRATYKVQIDVFDANDNKLGCSYFFANQDQLETEE